MRETLISSKSAMEPLLTVPELAERLRVPVSWIYQRTGKAAREKLPHIRAGRHIRFDLHEVLEHLRSSNAVNREK